MAPEKLFQRNIRPQRIEDEGAWDDEDEASNEQHDLEPDSNADSDDVDMETVERQTEDDQNSSDENDEPRMRTQISSISFGALKQAQDSLSRKRKRGSASTVDQEDKLEALRARLHQIRKDKQHKASSYKNNRKSPGLSARKTASANDDEDNDNTSNSDSDPDSDSAPSELNAPAHARSSKHAPMSQTSTRQVTRRRQVIEVPRRTARDPRFDAPTLSGAHHARYHHDEAAQQQRADRSEKAYAFLREYQEAEMAELAAALKAARNDDERTTLRRKLVSMQNARKTREAKAREREVVRQHRRAERERLANAPARAASAGGGEDGDRGAAAAAAPAPYFLKRKEIKERALAEKFKGMKGKEREKAIEKRRLKESQREKRRMPGMRRRAG